MKKIAALCLIMVFAASAWGQRDGGHEKKHSPQDITTLVSNLTTSQKQEVEAIRKESSSRVADLRSRQKAVKDSIHLFMHKDGDQSAILYPLFEREAALQVAINREMYVGKVRIDSVLTPEQRAELRKSVPQRKPRKNRR